MENANSYEYLEKIKIQVIENLKKTAHVPSVQMQDVPRNPIGGAMTDEEEAELDDLDEDENKDVRMTQRRWDQRIQRDDEFEESDDEGEGLDHSKALRRQAAKTRKLLHTEENGDMDVDSATESAANGHASGAEPTKNGVAASASAARDVAKAADDSLQAAGTKKTDADGDVDMADGAAPAAEAEKSKAIDADAPLASIEQPTPPQEPDTSKAADAAPSAPAEPAAKNADAMDIDESSKAANGSAKASAVPEGA